MLPNCIDNRPRSDSSGSVWYFQREPKKAAFQAVRYALVGNYIDFGGALKAVEESELTRMIAQADSFTPDSTKTASTDSLPR